MTTKKQRIDTENFEANVDGFYGRTRICKVCKTPTELDKNMFRYCPKGHFKANK